jgi:uncharacterized protein
MDNISPTLEMPAWKISADPIPADHAAFIEASSFVFLMSGAPDAAPDVSPRGDAPGFVRLVDNVRLQLPDRSGNNRIDTIRNVVADPRIALVFICRNDDRALYVTGRAKILIDPEVLAQFEYNERLPRSVMDIAIVSSTLRHSSAFAASGFWVVDGAKQQSCIPSLGEILADQVGWMSTEEAKKLVENSYQNKLY